VNEFVVEHAVEEINNKSNSFDETNKDWSPMYKRYAETKYIHRTHSKVLC